MISQHLTKEQANDDNKKEYCETSLSKPMTRKRTWNCLFPILKWPLKKWKKAFDKAVFEASEKTRQRTQYTRILS